MIRLEEVRKAFRTDRGPKWVIEGISCQFESRLSIGILGPSAVSKTTLLRLVSGQEKPTWGRIQRHGLIAWSLSLGGFHNQLTAVENTRFICRIYGIRSEPILDYVEQFTGLGSGMHDPLESYDRPTRMKLSLAVSLALPFDYYLIDESSSQWDSRILRKFRDQIKNRFKTCGSVLVSEDESLLMEYCTAGAILHEGRLSDIMQIDEAISKYHRMMGRS